MIRTHLTLATLAVTVLTAAQPAHAQSFTPVPFAKTDNIYTNLNQQYPHSGTGTPGSGVGTANQTFRFNPATYTSPNAVAGANKTTNGATFTIASDAAGHDFAEIGNGSSLVVPTSLAGVSQVSILVNGYNNPGATFTFAASGGATETFSSIQLHDFNGQGTPRNDRFTINGTSPDFLDQTAFQVIDVGAGGSGNSSNGAFGTYGIDEDTFILSSAFVSQTLQSITITAQGDTPIVLGISALTPAPEPSQLSALAIGLLGLGTLAVRAKRRPIA